jgi:hypothetical protein
VRLRRLTVRGGGPATSPKLENGGGLEGGQGGGGLAKVAVRGRRGNEAACG